MKLSARNKLKGTITAVKEGAVNAIVVIDIGGGTRSAPRYRWTPCKS